MKLIKSKDTRYEEYETLLLERDQIQKEAGQVWTFYSMTFGQLIAEIYEEKIECIKCKKTISYCQKALNHGNIINRDAMQHYLDSEMASYYSNLRRIIDDYNRCKNSGTSTSYEVQRSKELYRRLAKLIHPDINPETDRQECLKELWMRILTAYGMNNIRELSELEVLVRKALRDLGSGEIEVDIPDIQSRIKALKKEITEIKKTEPYTFRYYLNDEEAVKEKTASLQKELASYKEYRKELDTVVLQLLNEGGIKIQWLTN